MLCFTVKNNEPFFINDKIVITISKARNGHNAIAIEAPRDVRVERQKVRERRLKSEAA